MNENRIEVATVVFYDGVEAYTTHRAVFVDYSGKMKLTAKSKKALKADFDSAGCEVLKVDFNGQMFDDAADFMEHFNKDSMYRADDSEVQYVINKFVEYFVKG